MFITVRDARRMKSKSSAPKRTCSAPTFLTSSSTSGRVPPSRRVPIDDRTVGKYVFPTDVPSVSVLNPIANM